MPRNRLALTPENEERIKAALEVDPHATRVTSSFNGEFSYSTVQRVAYRNDIPLTAGRETMGPSRLPPERRAKVEALVEANPGASQSELERLSGVSRKVVRQCANQVGVE